MSKSSRSGFLVRIRYDMTVPGQLFGIRPAAFRYQLEHSVHTDLSRRRCIYAFKRWLGVTPLAHVRTTRRRSSR